MGKVFVPRGQAQKHQVTKGEKLSDIVGQKCPDLTWEDVAAYNFGTKEAAEVNRALAELIGASAVDEDDPGETVLDPDFGPGDVAQKELLIPRAWSQEDLSLEQTHTVKLKKLRPAPSIQITALDRWFIPEAESCEAAYDLHGVAERADKVHVHVHASNYCTVTATAAGDFVKYDFPAQADEPDEAIFSQEDAEAGERSEGVALRWDGESKATKGALKPRVGKKRYINAAFSPYTLHLRYFKHDDDKDAKITLLPFWPRWNAPQDAEPIADSLKIKWKIKDGRAAKLKRGLLLVWDKDGEVVLRKGLGADDVKAGEGEYAWDAGRAIVKIDKMPYRAQIQANSGMDEDDGLALAAMHFEVRLAVHKDVDTHPNAPWDDPQCLEIALAPFLPDETKADKDSVTAADVNRWYELRLAKAGFHPGPVTGQATGTDFEIALKEFQRSYPKNTARPFQRLDPNGTLDADTKAALERLADEARPMFGNPAGRADYTGGAHAAIVKDSAADIIVWVDDRHYYTSGYYPANATLSMGNYRGAYNIGDQRVDKDRDSIARPWIPLEVAIPLLSRNDDSMELANLPQVTDAMRRAVGPVRVDFTFTEIGEDLAPINAANNGYDNDRVRTRKYVQEMTRETPAVRHNGVDCTNCTATNGGIRPSPLGDYHKEPFGLDDKSLLPWKAADGQNAANEKKVYALVHDDLGQADDKLHADRVGKAGVYLNLSRIAGDGYRFRARAGFEQIGGSYLHPNHGVLEARYPKLPQAHTCKMRLWRKSALRAYVKWTPVASNWAKAAVSNTLFSAAFLHFLDQVGPQPTPRSLMHEGIFKELIRKYCAGADFRDASKMAFRNDYIWPWSQQPHYGINTVPPAAVSVADWETRFFNGIKDNTWRNFIEPLTQRVVSHIESQSGQLRGHILMEIVGTPAYKKQTYLCSACKRRHIYVETGAGHSAMNGRCKQTPACKGTLKIAYDFEITCDTCATIDTHVDLDSQGRAWADRACTEPFCGGQVTRTGNGEIAISPSVAGGLPLHGFGNSLGVAVLPEWGDGSYWAHEVGHNRHFEHAASAPDPRPAQHDSKRNTHDVNLQGEPADERGWDRACIMGYAYYDTHFFCGKCVLKNRGWRVEGLPDKPALQGGVQGP